MKYILIIIIVLFFGCKGEKDDPKSTDTAPKPSNISNITVSVNNIKKIAISSAYVPARSIGYSSVNFSSSGDVSNDMLVIVDASGDMFSPLSLDVNVQGYDFYDQSGDNILINGDFENLEAGSRVFDCWLIVSNIKTNKAIPKCIQEKNLSYHKVIPSTTAKELANSSISSTSGDQEKAYFAMNKIGGGFTIKRWDGLDTVKVLIDVDSGQVTSFYSGDVLVAAVGVSDDSEGIIFYGNPIFKWRYTDKLPGYSPIYFDKSIFYTKRINQYNGEYENFLISMSGGTALSYSPTYSIDCNLPDKKDDVFKGIDRVFWISAINKKLCSIKKYPERPEKYQYTIDDTTIKWEFGVNDGNKLFLYGLDVGIPHLQVFTIDRLSNISISNAISDYGLDTITRLDRYINGVKITGSKSSADKIVYFDTSNDSIDPNPKNTETMFDLRYVN